ncbi:MAG: PAS domain-containing protein [Spirochaetales bacterium]|nr:MAG: PAS domain-containing protein [Spirochaetales bacterium]
MNILSLLSLSSGIAYLFLGINVLRIDLRSRAFWYFFLVCFCFSFWSVSFTWFYSAPDVKTAETAYRAASPGWLFFISFAFMFFLNLTNRSIKTWVALVFLYLPPVIFCGKMFFSSFYFDTFIRIEGVWHLVMEKSLWTAAFSVWFFSLFTVSTVYILIWKKNSTSVKEKKQAGILIVSLAVNYILSPATNLFLPFLDIRILPQLAHLVALPFIFSIYIAITRYKMLVINPQLAVDTIMSTVADFLILLDKDLRISRVNKQCLVSLGYTEEELVQRDIFSLIRPGYDRSITAGGSSEIDFLRKNGSSIPVRITWTPLFDEFGDSIGYIAAGHNIEIERFLTEARAEADQANMAKSTFLAHMSHEIRTPIASLSGIIELLSLDFRKGSAGEYLHMAKDSVKSLMTLINDLLDISKIEAGKMEFHPSVFNLQSLLETVENTFNLRAEESGFA